MEAQTIKMFSGPLGRYQKAFGQTIVACVYFIFLGVCLHWGV